jgi:undecaprenyl-diphosphatase
MFADRMELVAAVAATGWLVLAATAVVARRRAVPRRLVRADVLVAYGVAALLFGAGAALADHVADAGKGPTGYDSAVWTFVVEHRATAGTVIASGLRVGGGIVALGALAWAVALLLVLRGRRLDALLVAGTPLVSTLLGDTLKLGYGRPRPPAAEQLIPEAGFSLPSGHTVDATVVLGVLALVLVARTASRRGRAAIVAAATVTITAAGAGRVYLGVHWATDVVTGWLLGAAWVALCAVVLLLAQTTTTGQGANSTRPRLVDPSIPSICGPRQRPTTTARAPAACSISARRAVSPTTRDSITTPGRRLRHRATRASSAAAASAASSEPGVAARRTLWPPAVTTMSLQVCTASTCAPCAAATSAARSRTTSAFGPSSTPTTTGPVRGGGSPGAAPRTTATAQSARASSASARVPASIPARTPSP